MQAASLVLGIVAMVGMLVALVPFLGWMNWGVIPFAGVGLVISITATATAKENRGPSIAGMILCAMAVFVGIARLIIGGGIL